MHADLLPDHRGCGDNRLFAFGVEQKNKDQTYYRMVVIITSGAVAFCWHKEGGCAVSLRQPTS